jgi:hypothetical protein
MSVIGCDIGLGIPNSERDPHLSKEPILHLGFLKKPERILM